MKGGDEDESGRLKASSFPTKINGFTKCLGMDSTCPKDVLTQLEFSDEDVKRLIIINSNGGNLVAGSEIYTHLRAHKGKVNVRITAIAASAASLIAMAGDHIEMFPVA